MNVVGLHPEELLDKFARNGLSRVEWGRLNAHVATCKTCRFELQARRDFADAEIEPPRLSLMMTSHDARAVSGAAIAGGLRPARRRSRKTVWLLALAAALFGGVSIAALSGHVFSLVAPVASNLVARLSRSPAHRASAVDAPKPSATVESPAPAANPSSPLRALAPAPAEPAPASATWEAIAERPSDKSGALHSSKAAPSAAELFHDANAARHRGDTERAIALYREVETRFSRSDEARVSYATLGSLLLDRGDARSALNTFDGYLSHGGAALGEEVLVGRALALQKLGSAEAEAAAWREVLGRFPKSVHARVARARLAVLGAP